MGNNTRKLILGAIAGFGLVFGMIGLSGSLQTQQATIDPSAYSTPTLLGHATILIEWPDGKTVYQQTDNQMNMACLSAIHNDWSGGIVETNNAGPFTTLNFYSETTLNPSNSAAPGVEFNTSPTAVVANYALTTKTQGAGIAPDLGYIITFPVSVFSATDVGEFVRQISLTDGQAAEQACASFVIGTCTGTTCGVSPATTYTVTWTLNTLTT